MRAGAVEDIAGARVCEAGFGGLPAPSPAMAIGLL